MATNYEVIPAYSSSVETYPTDINNNGEIIGNIFGLSSFIYQNGSYTILPDNATFVTINDAGTVVGNTMVPVQVPFPHSAIEGAIYQNGSMEVLYAPIDGGNLDIIGINNLGQMVGDYDDVFGGNGSGFLYSGGQFTKIDYPDGDPYDIPMRINDEGDIVGRLNQPAANGSCAYLYHNGSYATLDVPDYTDEFGYDINNHGEVLLEALDSHGKYTWFIYTNGAYVPIDLSGLPVADPNSVALVGMNDEGDIVGFYDTDDPVLNRTLVTAFVLHLGAQVNNPPAFDPVHSTVTGAIVERASLTGSVTPDQVAGVLTFTDADLADQPTAMIAAQTAICKDASGATVTLTSEQQVALASGFTITPEAGNTNVGKIDWSYSIADKALDFLGAGEMVVLTSTVQVDDHHGGTSTQNVSVTITGADEAPWVPATKPVAIANLPVGGTPTITQGYGGDRSHNNQPFAVDFAAPSEAEVRMAEGGLVVDIRTGSFTGDTGAGGYGNYVTVRLDSGVYATYAHLQSDVVEKGEHYDAGELVGYVGLTGETEGYHLHIHFGRSLIDGRASRLGAPTDDVPPAFFAVFFPASEVASLVDVNNPTTIRPTDIFGTGGNDGDGQDPPSPIKPDAFRGTDVANRMFGGAGSDTLDARGGADIIVGGTGADRMIGGDGNDTYYVDSASDKVVELAGPASGIDSVISSVSWTLPSSVERLVLSGVANLAGTGNSLANTLVGNSGRNVLRGEAGNDHLSAGAGNDVLIGGLHRDVLTGGAGIDIFRWDSAAETGNSAGARDIISDFSLRDDVIDLSHIDASVPLAGNNAFVWRGTNAFTTSPVGEVRIGFLNNAGTANDYTIVYLDTDTDVMPEAQIQLSGLVNLRSADFAL
jgi:VCBS repeat-containing protein